ncbi:hypothetical protein [Pseudomonas sp. Pseusp97]|uniref:hypothetical protein n=1 Tax=Pseudomonas sp. Pseusp97 TaxID=3243065 RepID=UPI0039A6759E
MPNRNFQVLRAIRSASYNDDLAAELLLELARLAPDAQLALRVLRMVRQIQEDSRALEGIHAAIAGGQVSLCRVAAQYRTPNCFV